MFLKKTVKIGWILLLLPAVHCLAQQPATSLTEALSRLEQRFGLTLSYDAPLLQPLSGPDIPTDAPLEECLQALLAPHELEYQIIGSRDVIIRPFEPKAVRLCGYVLDATYRTPLPYANVWILNTQSGSTTDEQGYFELEVRLPKNADLQASYLGYQTQLISAWQFTGTVCPVIELNAVQTELSTVTIKEFTTDMLQTSNPNGIQFKPQKIPTLPGWGEPDLLRSLQLLPGISSADESAANLNIRGSSPDHNLILWDDIPIYHTGHLFGFYSSVNPYIAQSVDIHRSGFGAQYGGRVSSVIDIKGKPRFSQKGEYGLGLNLINAHGFAEIPIRRGRSALLIAARRSYTDLIQSTTYRNIFQRAFSKGRLYDNQGLIGEAEGDVSVAPNFFYSDFNFKWAANPTDKLSMSISYYTNQDAFDYRFSVDSLLGTRDQLELSNNGISAMLKHEWNERSSTEVRLVSSRFTNNYEFELQLAQDSTAGFNTVVANRLTDSKFVLLHGWQFYPRHRFDFGLELNGVEAEYDFQENRQGQDLAFREDQYVGSIPTIFINYLLDIPDKFTMELGVRAEAFASEASGNTLLATALPLPRFAIRYHPFDKDFYIQSNGGFYRQYIYQIPAFYNDLGSGEYMWVLADNRFPVLNALHFSAGVGVKEGHFLMELEPYFKVINNLSSWRVQLEEGLDNPFTQDGTLVAGGIDLLVKQKWNQFNLWASYSIAFAANQYASLNNGEYFPADYDQLHRLNLTQTLALSRWDISATFNVSSGRPYTAPASLGTSIDSQTGIRSFFLEYEEQNNARLPLYHRLDVAANYKFETRKMQGKMGVSVFNLYNQRNLSDIDFFLLPSEHSSGTPRPARLERPMLGVTPNVFIQLRW